MMNFDDVRKIRVCHSQNIKPGTILPLTCRDALKCINGMNILADGMLMRMTVGPDGPGPTRIYN